MTSSWSLSLFNDQDDLRSNKRKIIILMFIFKTEMSDTDSNLEDRENDSDVELRETFAKGIVKQGLNIVSSDHKKHCCKSGVVQLNGVVQLKWCGAA